MKFNKRAVCTLLLTSIILVTNSVLAKAFASDAYSITLDPLPPVIAQQTSGPVSFVIHNDSQLPVQLYVKWKASNLGWQPTPAGTTCSILNADNNATESFVALDAGQHCILAGTFTPAQVGTQNLVAQLLIHADRSLSMLPNQFAIPVQSSGQPVPPPTPVPPPIPTPTGKAIAVTWSMPLSEALTIKNKYRVKVAVMNNGETAADLFGISWTAIDASDSLINDPEATTCGKTLDINQVCEYAATFTPGTMGAKSFSATVSYDGTSATTTATSSFANDPSVQLSAQWAQNLPTPSTVGKAYNVELIVTNESDGDAILKTPQWIKNAAPDFQDNGGSCTQLANHILSANGSCAYEEIYQPTAAGAKSLNVNVNYQDTTGISGAVQPTRQLTSNAQDQPGVVELQWDTNQSLPKNITVGTPYVVEVLVRNNGESPISLAEQSWSYTIVGVDSVARNSEKTSCDAVLGVNEVCAFSITYAAGEPTVGATPDKSIGFSIVANGVVTTLPAQYATAKAQAAKLSLKWDSSSLIPTVSVLDDSYQLKLNVTNTGVVAATLNAIDWHSTATNDQFTLDTAASTCHLETALAVGDTCQFVATYLPKSVGARNINVALTTADSQSFGPDAQVTDTQKPVLALGEQGVILASSDLKNWQFYGGTDLNTVTYNATQKIYVATGKFGTLLYSKDGMKWFVGSLNLTQSMSTSTSAAPNLSAVNYVTAKNKFIAVGDRNMIVSSSDGIHWIYEQKPDPLTVSGHGLFSSASNADTEVAVGQAGRILAKQGPTWEVRNSGITNDLVDVVYVGKQFIALSNNGIILSSNDGLTWNQSDNVNHNVTALATGNYAGTDYCVITGEQGTVFYAKNCTAPWNKVKVGTIKGTFNNVTYLPSTHQFIAVGNHGITLAGTLENGTINWSNIVTASKYNLLGVTVSDSGVVAVGAQGAIINSSDTINWNSLTTPALVALDSFIDSTRAGEGDTQQYIAATIKGELLASFDGKTWRSIGHPAIYNEASISYRVTYLNNTLIFYLQSTYQNTPGKAIYSSDLGKTWNTVQIPSALQNDSIAAITYVEGQFVVAMTKDRNLYRFTSLSQATDWQVITTPHDQIAGLSTDGGNHIIARYDNLKGIQVGTIHDATWQQANLSTDTDKLNTVTFAHGIYVMATMGSLLVNTSGDIVPAANWLEKSPVLPENIIFYGSSAYTHEMFLVMATGFFTTSVNGNLWTPHYLSIGEYISTIVN
jgi:hypothetical protein